MAQIGEFIRWVTLAGEPVAVHGARLAEPAARPVGREEAGAGAVGQVQPGTRRC